MTKHTCITNLSQNFYKATKDLSEPLVVTNHGKPVMTILKGDHSVSALAQREQSTPNSYSFSAQLVSTFNSQGYTPEQSQKIADTFKNLLSETPQVEGEVKQNEKDHTHK